MDIKELMIGNLIYVKTKKNIKRVSRVIGIKPNNYLNVRILKNNGVEVSHRTDILKTYPIPINLKRLQKLGFEKSKFCNQSDPNIQYYQIDEHLIIMHNTDQNRFFYTSNLTQIKSIHELQNLHFSVFKKQLNPENN